jgi:membrane protease YdiL (CAAX protease family)/DNA-directed RNA polymerase subunit RPC12/RpoP
MFCQKCGKKIDDDSEFCVYCGFKIKMEVKNVDSNSFSKGFNKKDVGEKPKERKKFSFWKTFAYIFIVLLILLVIFFGLVGSYEEGFGEAFMGVLLLSFMLAIIFTFIFKWRKDYKTTGELISEEPEGPINHTIKPGIRDWLILVAIGLVISPFIYLYNLFTIYLPIFTNGTWELVTNPNSGYFVPGIGTGVTFEVIYHLVFLVASVYLLFLFFKKDKSFPKFYIVYLVSILICGIVDYAIVQSIPSLASQVSDNSDLGKSVLAAAIWIPYMLKSKLVKATFVK